VSASVEQAVVLVERSGSALLITLNRPAVRNALNRAVATAVAAAMDELDADPRLRVGVLTGAGGAFCSGMDLKAFTTGDPGPHLAGRGVCGITETPPRKPLIAAVEGYAVGGGFELVLACDLVVAGQTARFGTPEVTRSIVAAGGAALNLPTRIPFTQAMELLLIGDPIDADRARELGLINRVVPAGTAVEEALALAERLARNGPLALEITKKIARSAAGWPAEQRWERQAELMAALADSPDVREGALAFAERRPPVWVGQ
jgi:enoyl-CoA hydratase